MLTIEIRADGGATISGHAGDLRSLASALLEAAVIGSAHVVYVPDEAVTTIDVVRTAR